MSPRFRIPAGMSAIALGLLFAVSLLPGAARGQSPDSLEAAPPLPERTPLAVFSALERFWSEDRADSVIARICPDEIRLSFRRIGPREGTFDHSEARYLLADLFSFARTDSFFFVEYAYDPAGDEPPRAVGHWYYRGADGLESEARVTVELNSRDCGWSISKIEARKW